MTDSVKEQKKAIRKEILAKRKLLTEESIKESSGKILENLVQLPCYREAETLYIFVGCRGEVDTVPIMRRARQDGKRTAVPKVLGDVMAFYYIDSEDELAPGCMNIPEPAGDPEREAKEEDALLVLPGLAFTKEGGRLGFGGGYYDRFQAAHPHLSRAAVTFSWEIVPELPSDEYDIPVPIIVTEEGIVYAD